MPPIVDECRPRSALVKVDRSDDKLGGRALRKREIDMRVRWFLAVSICLMGVLEACTVEVASAPPGAGGSGGTGGSAGAGAATADAANDGALSDAPAADGASLDVSADIVSVDTASDAPSTDTTATPDASADAIDGSTIDGSTTDASADGAIADTAADATGACFAEDMSDAGTAPDCAWLPCYGLTCRDDAGVDGQTDGAALCDSLRPDLKQSAFQELFACLQTLPGADGGIDACSSAHQQGAADCSRSIFSRSMCPVPDGTLEGGLYGCTQIAASCGPDSGDGGIPVDLCRAWLGPFKADVRQSIVDCYVDPDDQGSTSCRDKFENFCVFP